MFGNVLYILVPSGSSCNYMVRWHAWGLRTWNVPLCFEIPIFNVSFLTHASPVKYARETFQCVWSWIVRELDFDLTVECPWKEN